MLRLRTDLDFMPSPVPEQPGLLIRDPFGYSDAVLVVPPALIGGLQFLDGESSELDVRHFFVESTGDLRAGGIATQLIEALNEAGFLDNERFAELRDARQRDFAESPTRRPTHAGPGGYPPDADELRSTLNGYLTGSPPAQAADNVIGIAAPHVSPFGGWESYAAAYSTIPPSAADKTFVVLGTSHYGQPDRFGLTRKPFETPYGTTQSAPGIVDGLARAADGAVLMEDYCHAVEHSIEFQVVFLQHLFGSGIRVLPILCGPFGRSLTEGGVPEQDEPVRRFFDALSELQAAEGKNLFWVLGVDMAHVGRRYGDPLAMRANDGEMLAVEVQDRRRIGRMADGDAAGFWSEVQENQDPLRWCGSAPVYTFLKAIDARGSLLHYQQWSIDDSSVVSFAGMQFTSAGSPA